jgi:hypothetical protein
MWMRTVTGWICREPYSTVHPTSGASVQRRLLHAGTAWRPDRPASSAAWTRFRDARRVGRLLLNRRRPTHVYPTEWLAGLTPLLLTPQQRRPASDPSRRDPARFGRQLKLTRPTGFSPVARAQRGGLTHSLAVLEAWGDRLSPQLHLVQRTSTGPQGLGRVRRKGLPKLLLNSQPESFQSSLEILGCAIENVRIHRCSLSGSGRRGI